VVVADGYVVGGGVCVEELDGQARMGGKAWQDFGLEDLDGFLAVAK